ncbi:cytochrome P450 [Schizophyllum commune]
MLLAIVQIAFVCFLLYLFYKRVSGAPSGRPPLPPGPPAYPLIGHLGMLPEDEERAYKEWGQEYGSDVIHVNMLGQPIIVLNSAEAATDLLDKRGSIYSDRPAFAFFKSMGWHDHLTFVGSNEPLFPTYRRLFQNFFSKSESRKYMTLQENEARKLVQRVISRPGEWRRLLRLYSTAIIMQLITGEEILKPDDEYVLVADQVNAAMSNGPAVGAAGLDFFPWLKYLPSWCDPTGSTAHVRKWAQAIDSVQTMPLRKVMEMMKLGTAKPSLTLDKILEEEARVRAGEPRLLSDFNLEGTIGAAYAAAQGTTTDTMVVFVFAMTMYPEVQKKAKAELDTVVGPDRLPEFADREQLPYVERVVQETFRIWPSLRLGVPHRLTEDDVYKGMFLPKGSIILANATAISHDETFYADPWRFDPDRYIPKEQGGRGEPLPSAHFGYGRRICPGRFTADNSVFMAIATMLHVLRFEKAVGEDGKEVALDFTTVEYARGLGSHPKTFPSVISAASERAAELVAGYNLCTVPV